MPENDANKVTWDNVNQILDAQCQPKIDEAKESYTKAEEAIKKGKQPSAGMEAYNTLKARVDADLKEIDETKDNIKKELQKIKDLRQPFQEEIENYNQEIAKIEAQIIKIGDCLSQYPEDSKDLNILELRQCRGELQSKLGGFQSQKSLLVTQAAKIEAYPSTLFGSGSAPPRRSIETDDPMTMMEAAKIVAEGLKLVLKDMFTAVKQFCTTCWSILTKARTFRTSNTPETNTLIAKSNTLIENLQPKPKQETGNTLTS